MKNIDDQDTKAKLADMNGPAKVNETTPEKEDESCDNQTLSKEKANDDKNKSKLADMNGPSGKE